MSIKAVQFLAIILTALSLVPGGAHLIELPNKMALDRDAYLIVQQIYRGWALAGFALFGALAANLSLAVLSRSQTVPFLFASAGFVLMLATLISFFLWVFPVNQATDNWTSVSNDFQGLRARWEYTHAVNAVITFAALAATVVSSLAWSDS